MREVDFTVDEAAFALGVKRITMLRYCQAGEKFPRAHLLHNSRRLGYVIPSGDLLAYAEQQSAAMARKVQKMIDEKTQKEDALLAS